MQGESGMIEIGIISEVSGDRARASIGETLTTDFLPVLQLANSFEVAWTPLRVGEQCLVLPVRGSLNAGVILRGIYYSSHATPTTSNTTKKAVFEDGTSVEYDSAKKTLNASLVGDVKIQIAGNVTLLVGGNVNATVAGKTAITCPESTHTGNVNVIGVLSVTEAILLGSGAQSQMTSAGRKFVIDSDAEFKGEVKVQNSLLVGGSVSDSRGDLTNHTNEGKQRD